MIPGNIRFQGFFLADFIAVIRSYSQLKIVCFFPNFDTKIPNRKLKKKILKIDLWGNVKLSK